MQKNVHIAQDNLDSFSLYQESLKRAVPPINTHIQKEIIDKRWQEVKVTGENLQSRSFHSICTVGDYFYSYGGYENNERITGTFARIKIQNNNGQFKWEFITPRSLCRPGSRRRHTITSYQDKIYLFGGQTSNWQTVKVNDVYEYSITQNDWSLKKNNKKDIIIPELDSHNAFIYQDEMFIFGGYSPQAGYSNSLYAFNLVNYTWRIIPQNPSKHNCITKRSGSSTSQYGDFMYVFGGQNENTRLNDLWRFNIAQVYKTGNIVWEKLEPEADMPLIRNGHQSVTYQNFIFVFGGIHNMTQELNDIQAYNIDENRWIQVHTDSNFLYSSSPCEKSKRQFNFQHQESPEQKGHAIRNSLRRANSQHSPAAQKLGYQQRQSHFKNSNTIHGDASNQHRDSTLEPKPNQKHRNQSSSQMLKEAYNHDSQASFGKFVIEQKQKEFRLKKQHFLSTIEVDLPREKIHPTKYDSQTQKNLQNEKCYSRNDSPLTIALKNSLLKIGNQDKRKQVLNNSNSFNSPFSDSRNSNFRTKNLTKAHTIQMLDIKLPPIVFEKDRGVIVGKKPCARDGHACCLVRQNQLLIFGGDRHNMSFNDIYLFDLDMAIQKHITQATFE